MIKNPPCPSCQSFNTFADTQEKRLLRIKACAILTIPFAVLAYVDFRTIWVFLGFWFFFMVIIEGIKYRTTEINKCCCKDCKQKWEY